MRKPFVPPGGVAGASDMTAPQKYMIQSAMPRGSSNGSRRRKSTKRTRSAGAKRKRSTKARKLKRLVKGSAAAKRFMANLRRRRKR